jgi:hypothetical protein
VEEVEMVCPTGTRRVVEGTEVSCEVATVMLNITLVMEGTVEDLAEELDVLLAVEPQPSKEPRRELEKSVRHEGTTKSWFPSPRDTCERDIRINSDLGAGGFMTPDRIHDPEKANTVVVSFKTIAGATHTSGASTDL